jgi:protein involved in plasmid replication-relaxation
MPSGNRIGISLQPRDFALLKGLLESRLMTLSHTSLLYFDGKREMAKKRLQKLKAAGIILERPRAFAHPSVLSLSRTGVVLLRTHGHLSGYPHLSLTDLDRRTQVSDAKLQHELAVMNVKVAITQAVNATTTHHIAEFSTWPALYQFHATRPNGDGVTIQPDGFLRIHETKPSGPPTEHTFFLEVDRSTESLSILADKCHCYAAFYRSGGFAQRNGTPRDQYKKHPFRILLITKSPERRDTIAERLRENIPPIRGQAVFMTNDELAREPLGFLRERKSFANVLQCPLSPT